MTDNKYIGVQGLEELISLTKNELAKKSDIVQFYTMPDPAGYTGRMVQYVGTPGPEDTFKFGHFYFSIRNTWQEIAVQDEDLEKDIICHYKDRTTVDSLPSADRSNYSDIYRITDASAYGPPNTHVICSTVQGDDSRYEWRSLGGDIDYFRGLHDPDLSGVITEAKKDFDLPVGSSIIYTCPKRGFVSIMAYSDRRKLDISVSDNILFTLPGDTFENAWAYTPVNKGDVIKITNIDYNNTGVISAKFTYVITFIPYKVQ